MAFLSPAQAARLTNEDNTDKFKRQAFASGMIGLHTRPELSVTPYGGLVEYDAVGAFTTLYRVDGTSFMVRNTEVARYLAKTVASHDPSGAQKGSPLFSETPPGGDSHGVATVEVSKPRRKRRRHRRGRKGKAA